MKEKPAKARDYNTGRAARELRVSPNHVRTLCQTGMIAARATPGGHFRIPKSEIERLRREGVPEPPPGTPAEFQTESAIVPTPNPPHRHPVLLAEPSTGAIASADEVVRLENEVKAIGLRRAKEENLDWFRERDRKQAETKAARDRQVLESKAQRLRREWENSCLEYAFACAPDDAPEDARLSIAESVREILSELSSSDPEEVTGPLIGAAVERALRPWRRSKEIERAVQGARNQLPALAKSWSNSPPSEWELRAMSTAREAIAELRNDATYEEMQAVAIAGGRQVAQQYQDWNTKRAIVDGVFLRTPGQQEKARHAVRAVLDRLPAGANRAEMERTRDEVLAPFKAAEESARAQTQAASQTDFYLAHVDSYLTKIDSDPHSKWEFGSFSERNRLAQELKEEIRPIVIQEILEEPFSLDEAHAFIESLVDRRLTRSL
jgi:hypothetical protein